jgi:hypothetical protein
MPDQSDSPFHRSAEKTDRITAESQILILRPLSAWPVLPLNTVELGQQIAKLRTFRIGQRPLRALRLDLGRRGKGCVRRVVTASRFVHFPTNAACCSVPKVSLPVVRWNNSRPSSSEARREDHTMRNESPLSRHMHKAPRCLTAAQCTASILHLISINSLPIVLLISSIRLSVKLLT